MGTPLKNFVHPHKAYRLQYPAHWEQLQQDEARSCGFGPKERNDVGLWISIMPMSIDTERIVEDLPGLMRQALKEDTAGELTKDETLHHYGLKADIKKEGEGGHYWIVAGGDLVLFASTQVPLAERDVWNPVFERVMASLQITREDALLMRKVANDVLAELRRLHPEQEFEFDEKGIKGKGQTVYLSNVYREVRAAPDRKDSIIKHFIKGLRQSSNADMGTESLEEFGAHILPMLKPRDYVNAEGPTKHLYVTEWLSDVVIVYVIKNKKIFRFITGWDLDRWEIDAETLHKRAIENLARLPWPRKLEGSRQQDGGRVILVETGDSLASSRLLHPEFHHLFSGPLGSPFWAGIPDRNTLVAFSDRRGLKQRIGRQLKKDCRKSAYPITAQPFLVTADGVAIGGVLSE